MTNSGPGGGNVGDKSCCCFWFMSLWGLKQSQKEIVDTGAAFNAKNFKNHGHCTVQSISGSKHNISLLQQIAENDRVLVAIRHSAGIKWDIVTLLLVIAEVIAYVNGVILNVIRIDFMYINTASGNRCSSNRESPSESQIRWENTTGRWHRVIKTVEKKSQQQYDIYHIRDPIMWTPNIKYWLCISYAQWRAAENQGFSFETLHAQTVKQCHHVDRSRQDVAIWTLMCEGNVAEHWVLGLGHMDPTSNVVGLNFHL